MRWPTRFYMVLIGLPIHLIFDFFMAVLLATQIRGLSIYRTIFYLPSITPVVACGDCLAVDFQRAIRDSQRDPGLVWHSRISAG